MADFSGGPTGAVRDNPLRSDPVLFDMYMDALTVVLRRPEIRQACREFAMPPATIRMRMMNEAASVLAAAGPEWDAYRDTVAAELAATNAGAAQVTHGSIRDPSDLMRTMVRYGFAAGALMTVGGAVSSIYWAPMAVLAQAGATVLVVAAVVWAGPKFFSRGDFFKSLGFTQSGGMDLDIIRSRLMVTVSQTELLAQVRTLINNARQDRFGHAYSVAGAPGLSEVYDTANLIPTRVAAEMDDLLARFDGASIGVAGPRGSGKSTLVRQYCDEVPAYDSTNDYADNDDQDGFDFKMLGRFLRGESWSDTQPGELRCVVAAPVDYVARDFVLHLFATFCRAVIGEHGRPRGSLPPVGKLVFWLCRAGALVVALLWRAVACNAAVLVLVHWKHPISRSLSIPAIWVEYAAFAVVCLVLQQQNEISGSPGVVVPAGGGLVAAAP